jgi:hypothetical protein
VQRKPKEKGAGRELERARRQAGKQRVQKFNTGRAGKNRKEEEQPCYECVGRRK